VAASDPDDRAGTDRTENARRAARFKFARARIEKIVAGSPKLTDQELSDLAVLLHGGGDAA
jgi:hypothetical protein